MEAPVNAPPAKMLAPTMKPIAMGAIVPKLPFLGSTAVAYTVYTKPNVITISKTKAFSSPTPADRPKLPVKLTKPVTNLRSKQATTDPRS
uniref:Uncharacterized protein n=1 Tax=Cucumis melo TaxID=3656 RepID=A0A9I9EFS6_CUCME